MKVLVLGAGGMAGHVVATHLRSVGHVVTTVSARNRLDAETILFDVTDTSKLRTFLEENSFDIVVNCIGVLVKKSESRKDLSTYLNAYLPHFLENFYSGASTRLIHLSTDCVFSGANPPYRENAPYDGELFYDRAKALGEVQNGKDLTFRMSIIGPDMQQDGIGLFNWFYAQSGVIQGYSKSLWNGITTIELARGIDAAIRQNISGLYHLVPERTISKYDLLKVFVTAFDRNDITVEKSDGIDHDKTLLNTRSDFDFIVSDYPTMVREMKVWIDRHKDLYPHY